MHSNRKKSILELLINATQSLSSLPPEVITAHHYVNQDTFNATAPYLSKTIPIIGVGIDYISQFHDVLAHLLKSPETKDTIKNTLHHLYEDMSENHTHKHKHQIYNEIIQKMRNLSTTIKDTLKEKVNNVINIFKQHKNEKGDEIFNWHINAYNVLKQKFDEIKQKIGNPIKISEIKEIGNYIHQKEMNYELFRKYAKEK